MNKLIKKVRGASMVEYAVLLIAVLILSALAFKKLGPKAGAAADNANEKLNISAQ